MNDYNDLIKSLLVVYVTIFDKKKNLWFDASKVCKLLEYTNCKNALSQNVSPNNISLLKNISSEYKALYSCMDENTQFVNDAGLNELILGSKTSTAKAIQKWITQNVLMSLIKTKKYKSSSKERKQTNKINKKKDKFSKKQSGGAVNDLARRKMLKYSVKLSNLINKINGVV
jgi:prophage antirepressor-like protein